MLDPGIRPARPQPPVLLVVASEKLNSGYRSGPSRLQVLDFALTLDARGTKCVGADARPGRNAVAASSAYPAGGIESNAFLDYQAEIRNLNIYLALFESALQLLFGEFHLTNRSPATRITKDPNDFEDSLPLQCWLICHYNSSHLCNHH